ncbi:cellulase family glycosylhydrolase [Catenovulum sp. 2E275]|uniref:cellulase family glycosylhydrolase n=1 Tax=Catenovulum sp. 2E275 TaxID=2980497 RepID=UPI0021D10073|nr:cellulase family glycosylhydrolase [Catenovulum sp. 2E275]MCU4675961.1 cellulase family glycosylhydrolase [Catenovulum sp. 2E275]
MKISHFVIALSFISSLITLPVSAFEHFITRDGAKLMDGEKVFRFAGIHAPELHRIEDDAKGVCKADPRGWGQHFKWPTAEEQENWIQAIVGTNQKAMRIYVLSVEHESDPACGRQTHILKPQTKDGMPSLNEEAMRVYDRMIYLADKHGLRLILPFIDHWKWWGGREQLAAFYGEHEDEFYNVYSKTYAAYQSIIRDVVTRRNTFTGRLYSEEKAIMAWETGNELKDTNELFLAKTSAFIKALAPNQLVLDGTYTRINEFALNDPNVDMVSNHYYTNVGNNNPETVLTDLTTINGRKPYLIGEFGLQSSDKLDAIMQAAVSTEYKGNKAVGAFIWGFRGHRHNGGFYWHNEGGSQYYSYHLPGFKEGDFNEEIQVVDIARKAAAQMMGEKLQPLAAPQAPVLREITTISDIRWMGAPLGRSYRIERSTQMNDNWQTIAKAVSDGMNKFDPRIHTLFCDDSAKANTTYYYRVFANNESGESSPSNIQKVTTAKQPARCH